MDHFEHFACGIRLKSGSGVFPISTDSILLADFFPNPDRQTIADLGSGCGILGLLLCGRSQSCHITGLEIQPEAVLISRENIRENRLEERLTIVQGDIRLHRSLLPAGSFHAVISNPPYFSAESGATAASSLALARAETTCTLEQLCACAAWLLRYGGTFCLSYRPERLTDLLCTLRQFHMEPKRLKIVRHRADKAPCLVLVEARLGGKPGLQLEPELFLFNASGTPTEQYRKIYHL